MIPKDGALSSFRWSSYAQYLQPAGKRRSWLKVEWLLGAHGIPRDTAAGRTEFARRMEVRRAQDDPAQWKQVRRGWMLGSEEFRKELLERMQASAGLPITAWSCAREEEKAARIISQEIQRLKFPKMDLDQFRKSDPRKIQIARRLHQETTMPLRGSPSNGQCALHHKTAGG